MTIFLIEAIDRAKRMQEIRDLIAGLWVSPGEVRHSQIACPTALPPIAISAGGTVTGKQMAKATALPRPTAR